MNAATLPLPHPSLPFTVLMFAVVIGVLVFIHEFGHYIVGRWLDVRAEVFSIGFGRELIGWNDRRGTRWKLSLLPLGGYVKFAGDADASSLPSAVPSDLSDEDRAGMLQFRPIWQRVLVIAAGPATNFLFAIVVFAVFFMTYGQSFTPPIVDKVVPGSPAAAAGLRHGDRIIRLDGQPVERFEDIMRIIVTNAGTPVSAVIGRGGAETVLRLRPGVVPEVDRFGNRYTRGQLGVASGGRVLVHRNPVAAVGQAVREVWYLTGSILDGVVQVVSGRRAATELGGPIAIAKFSGQQAALGLPNFIQFMALISINFGFINLLPVPVLDGGHLFLYAIEALRKRPLAPKVQEWAFASGFTALMSLMVFLTWNDLGSSGVWTKLAGVFG